MNPSSGLTSRYATTMNLRVKGVSGYRRMGKMANRLDHTIEGAGVKAKGALEGEGRGARDQRRKGVREPGREGARDQRSGRTIRFVRPGSPPGFPNFRFASLPIRLAFATRFAPDTS